MQNTQVGAAQWNPPAPLPFPSPDFPPLGWPPGARAALPPVAEKQNGPRR